MRIPYLLLAILLPFVTWSQNGPNSDTYVPFACDSGTFTEHLQLTKMRFTTDLATVKEKPKLQRPELTSIYTYRYENIKYKYEGSHFYTDTAVTSYFQNILNTILKANPQLPTDVRLLISRYPWANAVCYGEGTIVFNLDLLAWMENESQVAFVICHELAHYYANHVNQDIHDYVAAMYDPEMQKKLRQIYYSQYNTYEQAMALYKDFTYSDRKHSRLHEAAADSIALVLLRNTPYNEYEALGALGQLDKVDAEPYDTLAWHHILNFNGYPFKASWLQEESGLSSFGKVKVANVEGFDADSLKTHPECAQRIALLQSWAHSNPQKMTFLQPQVEFEALKSAAKFERIHNVLFFENYGKCLFLATHLLQQHPHNTYLLGIIGQCWHKLYQAQEKHKFGKYVDLPNASDIYAYNQLLLILNNLRLGEIGKIGFHYLNQHSSKAAQNEELLYSLMQFSKIEGSMELYVSLQNQYKKTYPEGKYITKL